MNIIRGLSELALEDPARVLPLRLPAPLPPSNASNNNNKWPQERPNGGNQLSAGFLLRPRLLIQLCGNLPLPFARLLARSLALSLVGPATELLLQRSIVRRPLVALRARWQLDRCGNQLICLPSAPLKWAAAFGPRRHLGLSRARLQTRQLEPTGQLAGLLA